MRSKALFFFAVYGFLFSFLTHFITYFGINLQKYIPFLWILHIGFVTVLVISLIDTSEYKGDKNDKLDQFLKGIST